MLQITESNGGGVGIAVADRTHTPARRPSREASNPENGLSNLLREFLGQLSSAHLDLDHGSAA
jgi:hypothetical protein